MSVNHQPSTINHQPSSSSSSSSACQVYFLCKKISERKIREAKNTAAKVELRAFTGKGKEETQFGSIDVDKL